MGMYSQNAYRSNADGQLTVAGNKVLLQYAYAMAQPGFFDKTEEDIVVIVSNIPLSDRAVEDRFQRSALVSDGTLKSVEIVINSKQQPISVSVRHPAFNVSPGGYSSNYILELKIFNKSSVAGRMYCKAEQKFFDTIYNFDFTFNTEIRKKKQRPSPTEDEREVAAESPQAALYLKFIKALNAEDVKTLKRILAAEVAKELDGPDKDEMLEFMQMVNPPKVEFQRITVKGDSANLMLIAQDEGVELKGMIEFIKEDDQWKVILANWEEN
jgi:hypothetical protein